MAPYCSIALLLFSISASFAQATEQESRDIHAAIVLDAQEEPLIGTSSCRIDQLCELISDEKLGVKLTVKLRRHEQIEFGDLSIRCNEDCSLFSGRSDVMFQSERAFDLYRGAENRVLIEPVLRKRIRVGQIFLIVQ